MKKFFNQIKLFFIDIKNKREFKKNITEELNDPNSKMNGFEIKVNNNYSKLSTIITVPDEYQLSGTDMDILNKLKETVRPMTQYLCFELGWAEYILVPEFFYLDDPNNPSMSRTYLATWEYMPQILNNKSFWCKIVASILILLGLIITPFFIF